MKSNSLFNPSTGEPLEVHTSRPHTALEPFDLNAQWGEQYTIGLDLGQSRDSTAIAVVRKVEEPGHKPTFQVGNVFRLPLGTTYPEIVSYVSNFILGSPRFRGKSELVIDLTGVGRPVFDMFRVQGLSPIGVCFTAGNGPGTNQGNIYSVPKGHLVSGLQSVLYGQLKIRASLADVPALIKEIEAFRVEFSETGHMRFNARSGAHDDMIMALAIAVWRARGSNSHNNWMEFMRREMGAGMIHAASNHQPQLVKLQRPKHNTTTTIQTITGETINIGLADIVEIANADQVTSMLQQGWSRVEAMP
jgi:hypothetical protein